VIVITALTSTRIAGAFQFVADPMTGTTGTRTITDGVFDIPISAGGAGVAAANKGSSTTATINGSETFVASSVAGSLSGNVFTLVASTLVRNVSMSLANVTSTGTYTLSGSTPVRTLFVGNGVGAVWRSDTTGGSGSVVISTFSPDRIAGTFTATVIGTAGGASGPLTISGSFSFGRGI